MIIHTVLNKKQLDVFWLHVRVRRLQQKNEISLAVWKVPKCDVLRLKAIKHGFHTMCINFLNQSHMDFVVARNLFCTLYALYEFYQGKNFLCFNSTLYDLLLPPALIYFMLGMTRADFYRACTGMPFFWKIGHLACLGMSV